VQAEGTRTIVTFDVKDDHSPIQRVESSEDGQQWRAVFPTDGIADSKSEHYEIRIDGALGSRGLTLRASDTMNNLSTAQVDAPRSR
jgi:flavin-binding protein dodecin